MCIRDSQQRHGGPVAVGGRGDHVHRVHAVGDPRLPRPPAQRALAQLRLEAARAPALAGLRAARHRQMGDRARLGARPVVDLVVGGERRVDHVADEQVQDAAAAPHPPEQPLRVDQRPRVPVHMDRQPGTRADHLPHRHVPPAQQRMRHHRPGVPVHPAADRHPDAQGPAFRRPGQQRRQPVGGPRQHLPGLDGSGVLQSSLGHHPAAQIQQGDRGVGDGHMDAAHDEPRVVQVDGHMGASHTLGAAGRGGLTDETGTREPGAVVGHGRGGQPGQPGDGAARDRPVLQHGAQHDAGTGPAPVRVGGARNRRDRRGSRHGTGHGESSSGTGSDSAPSRKSRRTGSAPPAPPTGGDRRPCPRVADRRGDATRSSGPGQPCARS